MPTYTALTTLPDETRAQALGEALEDLEPEPVGVGVFELEDGSGLWEVGAYFTEAPDEHLRTLCERLQIPFDAGYAAAWADNAHVTGDISLARTIAPVRRKPVDGDLLAACRGNADYQAAIALLGYPE